MLAKGVVVMTQYVTHARPWLTHAAKGWELHVDGVGVTQVGNLEDVDAQVRDLLETMLGRTAANDEIRILVEDHAC